MCDIVFMLPPTIISNSILRREERELEGTNVSGLRYIVSISAVTVAIHNII